MRNAIGGAARSAVLIWALRYEADVRIALVFGDSASLVRKPKPSRGDVAAAYNTGKQER
jgi:hypothetical protein